MNDAFEDVPSRVGVEIGLQLKRVMGVYRLYGQAHELAREAESELFKTLEGKLARHGALTFRVEVDGLWFHDALVIADEGKKDSITRPLFSDGVQSLTIYPGLTAVDWNGFVRNWFAALTSGLSEEHTFATWVWEADYPHIFVEIRPDLTDGADAESARTRGRLVQLVNDMTREVRPEPHASLDVHALSVLPRIEGFKGLTSGELARWAEAPQAALEALTSADIESLGSQLTASEKGAGQRTLWALWNAMRPAVDAERDEVLDFVRRIFGTLIEEQRGADVLRALDHIAGPDALRTDLRAFRGVLTDPALLATLGGHLGSVDTADTAAALLLHLPFGYTQKLVPMLGEPDAERVARLVSIIVKKAPSPEVLAGWVLDHDDPGVAEGLLQVARALSSEHVDMVVRTLLLHDDAQVRKKGVLAVQVDQVSHHRTLLVQCAEDTESSVRQAALQILIRAREPVIIELLSKELLASEADPTLVRMGISALTSLGGPRARATLIQIFREDRSVENKKAAALALAAFGDPEVVELLEAEVRRVLSDREIKEVCRQALRRISRSSERSS